MSPRLLLIIFDVVYLVALVAWVGAILFVSFGVAPIIFRVLDAEAAAKFVRALFPRYYAWGAGATAIALPALVCGALAYPELRGVGIGVQALLLVAGLLIMLYCGNSLTTAINAARDAGPAEVARFHRLHRRSVWLNGVALVLGLVLLVEVALRRPVLTSGLREPSPVERSTYAHDFTQALDEILRSQATRTDSAETKNTNPFVFDAAARRELETLVRTRRGQVGLPQPERPVPGAAR